MDGFDDSVKVYLSSIQAIPLLKRDQELEIARKIREGEADIRAQLLTAPFAFRRILHAFRKFNMGKLDLEVISCAEDPAEDFERFMLEVKRIYRRVKRIKKVIAASPVIKQSQQDLLKRNEELLRETVLMFSWSPAFMASLTETVRWAAENPEAVRSLEISFGMTAEELGALYASVSKVVRKTDRLKGKLAEGNLRLVVSVAKRYMNRGLQLVDLIQEGNIGLMKAIDRYDCESGYKFSTYATWWIRQSVTRAIADQGHTIRLPVHMIETVSKVLKTKRTLVTQGLEGSPAEIAKLTDIPIEAVQKALGISVQEPLSLDSPMSDDSESVLRDMLSDETVAAPTEVVTASSLGQVTREALKTLSPKEQKILRMRFGLEGNERTLEEVGEEFALTRERIRQIESIALRRLRHPAKSRKLRDFSPAI